ncbi:hypothetical protein IP88_14235 [alpha proteobacterium AAP81b]|nr:hypothetical protein IP88_14235 [alpha proteobacterium AAP81b]
MDPTLAVDGVAHNIQLAVAPVFLLAGIGSILNVMTARLGRAVDRARRLESEIPGYPSARRGDALKELRILDTRMRAANRALLLCTSSALLVCVVVALLFIGDLFPVRAPAVVATLFILAMVLLIAGLAVFLYEVQIALRGVQRRAEEMTER